MHEIIAVLPRTQEEFSEHVRREAPKHVAKRLRRKSDAYKEEFFDYTEFADEVINAVLTENRPVLSLAGGLAKIPMDFSSFMKRRTSLSPRECDCAILADYAFSGCEDSNFKSLFRTRAFQSAITPKQEDGWFWQAFSSHFPAMILDAANSGHISLDDAANLLEKAYFGDSAKDSMAHETFAIHAHLLGALGIKHKKSNLVGGIADSAYIYLADLYGKQVDTNRIVKAKTEATEYWLKHRDNMLVATALVDCGVDICDDLKAAKLKELKKYAPESHRRFSELVLATWPEKADDEVAGLLDRKLVRDVQRGKTVIPKTEFLERDRIRRIAGQYKWNIDIFDKARELSGPLREWAEAVHDEAVMAEIDISALLDSCAGAFRKAGLRKFEAFPAMTRELHGMATHNLALEEDALEDLRRNWTKDSGDVVERNRKFMTGHSIFAGRSTDVLGVCAEEEYGANEETKAATASDADELETIEEIDMKSEVAEKTPTPKPASSSVKSGVVQDLDDALIQLKKTEEAQEKARARRRDS